MPGETVPAALLAAFATAFTFSAGGGGGGGAPNRARNASPFSRPTKLKPPNLACCAPDVVGKFPLMVQPVTQTLPDPSSATPWTVSSIEPPIRVPKIILLPSAERFTRKPSPQLSPLLFSPPWPASPRCEASLVVGKSLEVVWPATQMVPSDPSAIAYAPSSELPPMYVANISELPVGSSLAR